MNKMLINGKHGYKSTTYLLHTPTMTLGVVTNASCTADAESLFAERLNIERDGIFIDNCKNLRLGIKKHEKILKQFKEL